MQCIYVQIIFQISQINCNSSITQLIPVHYVINSNWVQIQNLHNANSEKVAYEPKTLHPEEWRRTVLVPTFKKKGDVQNCGNYRRIKLKSHAIKYE